MWKVTVKGQISVLIGCFLFQQGILLYKNFSLIRDDIFPGIQPEDDSFQFFSRNRVLLFYWYGHLLSLVFVSNPFINNCLCIILGCQSNFFLLGIQDKILSCHNLFQIISSQRQVVKDCHSLFACSQFGYQIIFFVTDKQISFLVLCPIRWINSILGIYLKLGTFYSGFFIFKSFIDTCFFFPGYRIFYLWHKRLYFCQNRISGYFDKLFSFFGQEQASHLFIVFLFYLYDCSSCIRIDLVCRVWGYGDLNGTLRIFFISSLCGLL